MHINIEIKNRSFFTILEKIILLRATIARMKGLQYALVQFQCLMYSLAINILRSEMKLWETKVFLISYFSRILENRNLVIWLFIALDSNHHFCICYLTSHGKLWAMATASLAILITVLVSFQPEGHVIRILVGCIVCTPYFCWVEGGRGFDWQFSNLRGA